MSDKFFADIADYLDHHTEVVAEIIIHKLGDGTILILTDMEEEERDALLMDAAGYEYDDEEEDCD